MRVLITGSTGFVGSNIIDLFIHHTDIEVVGVYRHTPPRSCDAEYVQCDLLDREDIRKKLSELRKISFTFVRKTVFPN